MTVPQAPNQPTNTGTVQTTSSHSQASKDLQENEPALEKELVVAILTNDGVLLQKMIEKGLNKNIRLANTKFSLMHLAIGITNEESVQTLIRLGFPVDLKNEDGRTPLCCLVISGLLPEAQKQAEWLIEAGASLEDVDAQGKTMLMYALKQYDRRWMTFLLDNGASMQLPPVWQSDYPSVLHWVVKNVPDALAENLNVLWERATEQQRHTFLHGIDSNGNTIFHWLAMEGRYSIAEQLAKNGGNPSCLNNHQQLPSAIAQPQQQRAFAELEAQAQQQALISIEKKDDLQQKERKLRL